MFEESMERGRRSTRTRTRQGVITVGERCVIGGQFTARLKSVLVVVTWNVRGKEEEAVAQ